MLRINAKPIRTARTLRAAAAGAFLTISVLPASTAAHAGANGSCRLVKGSFSAASVPPSECASPVGLCTRGQLTGTLAGSSYELTMNTIEAVPEADLPTVSFFTGTSVINTKHGDVWVGIDTGALNAVAPPVVNSGRFSTLLTFTSGVEGFLWIHGTLDLSTGTVSGDYSGRVCR
jgi:hypothetical protein